MTSIPQTVKTSNLRPEFYRREDGTLMIRVANLASKDVYEAKAQPEHSKQFPDAFEAFERGKSEPDVGGTPLTDVPGINKDVARAYRTKGVRNAEELAALSDAACSAMGHGVLTARKSAINLLKANQADALQKQLDKGKRSAA
jgi:hypothetical protein